MSFIQDNPIAILESELKLLRQQVSKITSKNNSEKYITEETEEDDWKMKIAEIQKIFPPRTLSDACQKYPHKFKLLQPVDENSKESIVEKPITFKFVGSNCIELNLSETNDNETLYVNLRTNLSDDKIKHLTFKNNHTILSCSGDLLPIYRKLFAVTDNSVLPIQPLCVGVPSSRRYTLTVEYSSTLSAEEQHNIWFKIGTLSVPDMCKNGHVPLVKILQVRNNEATSEPLTWTQYDISGRVYGLVLSKPHRKWKPADGIHLKFDEQELFVPEHHIHKFKNNVFFVNFHTGINCSRINRVLIHPQKDFSALKPTFGLVSSLVRNYIVKTKKADANLTIIFK